VCVCVFCVRAWCVYDVCGCACGCVSVCVMFVRVCVWCVCVCLIVPFVVNFQNSLPCRSFFPPPLNLGRPTVSYPYICSRDKINMSCHKMVRKRMITCSCRVFVSVCANRQAGRVCRSAQVRCFCCPTVGVQHLYGGESLT